MAYNNPTAAALRTARRAAAVANLAALTSAPAAAETPTKAEFDKVVADLTASRTKVNDLLATLRTAKLMDP